ncbi:BT_2262 family domain-containing protein [Saccharicrinis sp. FJH62]|uniref:BT_2262 family domain-containing protein n=1 Tax=Saccharicrinis sp. FJH62 TaxID=3344657 RepID=UPI0035D446D0
MKKGIYILGLFTALIVVLSGCEKKITSWDNSKITYFVTFELEGDQVMTIPVGQAYAEPGYKAMEGETDVTGDVDVSGSIDQNSLGVYTLTYSAVNGDGYSSSVSRTVIVYDPSAPSDDFSGTYTTAITRTESDGTNPRDYAAEMTITKVAQGIFYVDCLLGGTYSIGYGYGASYAMTGYLSLNSDYTLTLLSSYVRGWGDGLEGFQNGVYDPVTGLPYWESIYASGDIYAVTASK